MVENLEVQEFTANILRSNEHGITLSSLELKRSRPEDLNPVESSTVKKARIALSKDTETAGMDSAALAAMRGKYKRDPIYYMEDGSCTLLVEDTLFNVRSPLTILHETLQNME
jgi:hypothetical protein